MKNILAIILGGGQGTRLYPLTKYRSKPAVSLGGRYRLVDIPISNCLNSEVNQIYVLTQFNSESLNKHINRTYRLDTFNKGFIEIMAAEQSIENKKWFQGTADAVRRSLKHLNNPYIEDIVILSGDQLYRMDIRDILKTHYTKKSDITVCCKPIAPKDASSFGTMSIDRLHRVKNFVEKPKEKDDIEKLLYKYKNKKYILASMGIYVFKKRVLVDLLTSSNKTDFGKDIIPDAIGKKKITAHLFYDYWEDIGTIKTFYKANLLWASSHPPINVYEQDWQIFTHPRYLPGSRINNSTIDLSLIADGCRINNTNIKRSIIGLRSIIKKGTQISDSIIMGADFFENYKLKNKEISIGIGKNCVVKKAIIDKNVRMGDNVKVINKDNKKNFEGKGYSIKDGIIVVEKNAMLPSGTVI